MTLWSITRSPLMWGGNLTENRAAELALMTNAAVLAVDQNSTNNRQLSGGTRQVWAADVPGHGPTGTSPCSTGRARRPTCRVNLADLGIGSATVTDLWSGRRPGHGHRHADPVDSRRTAPGCTGSHHRSTVPPPVAYTLTARHSGKLADVFNASTADGANVVQWAANGQTNQRWRFRDAGGGYSTVVSVNSGKCLDVYGGAGATGDGVRVVQWACHGGTNQQWRVQDLGTGYLTARRPPQQQVPARSAAPPPPTARS